MINNILFLLILLVIVMTIFLTFTTYKYFKDYKTKLMNNNVVYDLPEEYKESQKEYIMQKRINVVFISFVVLVLFAICFFTFTKIKSYNDNKPKTLPNGTVAYNFFPQKTNLKAKNVLHKYLLIELNRYNKSEDEFIDFVESPQKAEELYGLTKDSIYALEYDLNDDGENEIIGFSAAGFYYCAQGYSLYILEKKNNKYINILNNGYMFHIEPILNLYILENKTNGYNDIVYRGSYLYNFPTRVIKYGKNGYVYSKFLK